jgi:hypothetical protein
VSLLPYSVSHLQWLLSFGSHLLVTCHAWQRVLALLWLLVQCKHVLSDGPSSLAACCGCIDTLLLRPQQTSLLLSLLLLLPAAAAPFSSSLALTPFGQACRSETAAWCRWHAIPCFRQALCYSVLRCLAVLLCSWYAFFNLIACLFPCVLCRKHFLLYVLPHRLAMRAVLCPPALLAGASGACCCKRKGGLSFPDKLAECAATPPVLAPILMSVWSFELRLAILSTPFPVFAALIQRRPSVAETANHHRTGYDNRRHPRRGLCGSGRQ